MTPGWDAPVTCTCVPMGSEPDVQPFVAVLPPVPEQWAAWPMYTVLEASKKTKFAVHCAPAVKVWTPGWIGAVAAGAQVGAALAEGASAATNGRATVAHVTAAAKTRASSFMGRSSLGGPHARYRRFGSITPISTECMPPGGSPSTPWRTPSAAERGDPPPVDATAAAKIPAHPEQGGVVPYSAVKRLLIGRPLSSREFEQQRLPKRLALGVFSTDAIASTAFATQEILVVLVPAAGMAALGYLVPISLLVVALLAIVVLSYRQTLYAYPNGGGSYIVSRENLGTNPSLVAAASLLVDYTLTVSVSVAAGVAAITSAVAALRGYEVELAVALIVMIAVGNLRGVRESGRLFAPPTYVYVSIMTLLVVWGLFRTFTGDLQPLAVNNTQLAHFTGGDTMLGGVTFFLLMRAFSSGAVALSGVEAISNGVQAFRKPESRNAAITLVWTAFILGSLFTGIAVLADQLRPTLSENQTILSQMGHAVFGGSGPLYIVLQASTAAILTLSANTAYADFPRLAAITARDGC